MANNNGGGKGTSGLIDSDTQNATRRAAKARQRKGKGTRSGAPRPMTTDVQSTDVRPERKSLLELHADRAREWVEVHYYTPDHANEEANGTETLNRDSDKAVVSKLAWVAKSRYLQIFAKITRSQLDRINSEREARGQKAFNRSELAWRRTMTSMAKWIGSEDGPKFSLSAALDDESTPTYGVVTYGVEDKQKKYPKLDKASLAEVRHGMQLAKQALSRTHEDDRRSSGVVFSTTTPAAPVTEKKEKVA